MSLRRGFKAEAEREALRIRNELGLGPFDRLDPLALAEHLAIPVWPLSRIADVSGDPEVRDAVNVLRTTEQGAVSAMTIIRGTRRGIVYNDAHDDGRTANSIVHECAHGCLLHPPAPALDNHGCRIWNADHEDEATFLAGALLIPSQAAWALAKRKTKLAAAAAQYGCSADLVRMRINLTGAGKRF